MSSLSVSPGSGVFRAESRVRPRQQSMSPPPFLLPETFLVAEGAVRSVRREQLCVGLERWCRELRVPGGTQSLELIQREEASQEMIRCHESREPLLDLTSYDLLRSMPPEIHLFTEVSHLRIPFCMTLLPPEIGSLRSLISLDLSGSEIENLPEEIKFLTSLEELNLNSCLFLRVIPLWVREMPSLLSLRLSNLRSVSSFPEALGAMSRCVIHTDEWRISQITGIMQRRDARPGAVWIVNSLPVRQNAFREENPGFFAGFKLHCASQGKKIDQVFSLVEIELLNAFFKKMGKTLDFKNENTRENSISTSYLILQTCLQNPSFKEKVLLLVHDALDSCEDRAAITFNRIEVERRFLDPEISSSLKACAQFLIGYRRLQLVHEEAEKIIKEYGFGDAIEPVLYLQNKLKKSLGLPIATEKMMYEGVSGISDLQLEGVKKEILEKSSTPQKISSLLSSPLDISPTNPWGVEIEALWEERFKQFRSDPFDRLNAQYQRKGRILEKKQERDEIDEGEYIEAFNQMMQDRKRDLHTLLVEETEIFLKKTCVFSER